MKHYLNKIFYLTVFIFSLTNASAEYGPRCSPKYIDENKPKCKPTTYNDSSYTKNSKKKIATTQKKNTTTSKQDQKEISKKRLSPTMYGYQKTNKPANKPTTYNKTEQKEDLSSPCLLKLLKTSKTNTSKSYYRHPSVASPGLFLLMDESKKVTKIKKSKKQDICNPCCIETPKTISPSTCAYNAPAKIDTSCGTNLWLSLSFIYWQVKEEGLTLGHYLSQNTEETVTINNPINISFDYTPGFKVGMGYNLERDDWTVYLEYTRLKSNNTFTKDISDTFGNNTWLESSWLNNINSDGSYSFLKSKWEIDYNIFNLTIGRPFYLGKKVLCKPFYGLKAGWMDQKYNIESIDKNKIDVSITNKYFVKDNQDTWLIGPYSGIDTDCLLGCNLRLYNSISGSLTYQNFKTKINEACPVQVNNPTENIFKGKNIISALTPNIKLSLGFGYGTYFSNNKLHIDITAGYDFQYFWEQQMFNHLQTSNSYLSNSGLSDLMLHGFTASMTLNF